MPDTFTATLNLTKVGINESDDTWGTKLNTNCDKIDAAPAAKDAPAKTPAKAPAKKK